MFAIEVEFFGHWLVKVLRFGDVDDWEAPLEYAVYSNYASAVVAMEQFYRDDKKADYPNPPLYRVAEYRLAHA